MLPPSWSGLDLFFHLTLVVYFSVFLFLHADQVRILALAMADMMNPQTPPRKQLFKPSSKTKTPTPVKRQRPTTPTPSSARSHDVLTPTETVSRGTDVPGGASEVSQGAVDSIVEESVGSDHTDNPLRSIAGKPREVLSPSTNHLPVPSNPTDALNSPVDIAKYFAEQGNSEMSTFVSALTGKASNDQPNAIDNDVESSKEASGGVAGTESSTISEPMYDASEIIKELPKDDNLIVSPNMRTKEAEANRDEDEIPDLRNSAEISSDAGGTMNQIKGQMVGVKPLNTVDEADTSNIPKEAQVGMPEENGVSRCPSSANNVPDILEGAKEQIASAVSTNTVGEPDRNGLSKEPYARSPNGTAGTGDSARGATDGVQQQSTTNVSGVLDDGTRVANNMGHPAYIDRRIEIPLPRPEKVISSPPQPPKPDMENLAAGLKDPDDLPGTQDLLNTDELQGIPDDPPEEILDPSVHSPSSNISPIPKIPKITPIGIEPPPNLLNLAHGLGGNMVDDVGNIVNTSGEILGHATGDLPAMVGREVADNGEIYGERGEVIGYVSENFTEPPPAADIPENVLGGLKVDHEGNILDSNGNIIGRFNEKAGGHSGLAPFVRPSKKGESPPTDDEPNEEAKPKVNAHTGGSPSDIFLDVKSTTDGIQLTIRIPTTFGRQPQE